MAKAIWLGLIIGPLLIAACIAWPAIVLPALAAIVLMVVGVF